MINKPTVLMILDGYGLSEKKESNAVFLGHTPNVDKLLKDYPWVQGHASGLDVGLPHGQMGNSEVGHLNIGAGRIVYQQFTRISKAIEDKSFFDNEAFLKAVNNCKKHHSSLHLLGLVSDGGVHSHQEHLYALLKLAKQNELEDVYVHVFLDGRDTPPTSGKQCVEELEEKMREIGVGKIATVIGRYYSMDRDNRWERTKLAYDALVFAEGNKADSAMSAVQASYDDKITDEFVIPTVVTYEGEPTAKVQDNDSIIFFNFRPDRARQLTRAFCDEDFSGFKRESFIPLTYICFTEYDVTIPNKSIAFDKVILKNTLGEYLASQGKTQLRLAETEKYPHVTFFFNGGIEEPNQGEDRTLIPSPKVATYDLQPEMSAYEVSEKLNESILSKRYDLIVINFANPDMVGHTGVEEAAIKAVETVDECVGKALEALLEVDGQMFVCADHGNAEQLTDYETGLPHTAHTINPVPFILVNYKKGVTLDEGGKLSDIAPTLLDMMGIEQPKEMTGRSLLK